MDRRRGRHHVQLLSPTQRSAPVEIEGCAGSPGRAGASIDLEHDAASEAAGDRIQRPTLILWGSKGLVGRNPESPLSVWRHWATFAAAMEGGAVEGAGHFMAEDRPEDAGGHQAILVGRGGLVSLASEPKPTTGPARVLL